MKICTWNMRRNINAWDWLLDTLDPDVALLQESVPPRRLPSNSRFISNHIGGSRNWGSGIFVKNLSAEEVRLKTGTYEGWVTAAQIKLKRHGVLVAISLHAQIVDKYSITTLHHILSDLTYLIDKQRKNVLLGGDFNAALLWDQKQEFPTHRIMFDRVEAFGLTNCHRLFHDTEQRTYRMKNGEDWQPDHIFVRNRLSSNVRSCDVLESDEVIALSDHNPIVMVVES